MRQLIFLSVALFYSAFADASVFTVKTLAYEGNMPFVESSDSKLAADINSIIYRDLLDLPAPKTATDAVPEASDGVNHGQSDLSYKVLRNDSKLLAIAIRGESCGAYCENYSNFYNFDASSGKRIDMETIFTPEGIIALDQQLAKLRIARIDKELKKLQHQQKQYPADYVAKDDEITPEDSIGLYESCVETMSLQLSETDSRLLDEKLKMTQTGVVFVGSRCSNHAMAAADTIGKFENFMSYKAIAAYLSAYGKRLLLSTKNPSDGKL